MNPRDIEKNLTPVVGADIARSLARIAQFHKEGAATSVSVPSWVLVKIGETMVELVRGKAS